MADEEARRLLTPPLGWPIKWRVGTITPANRPPPLVWNRYPGQIVGIAVRLPDEEALSGRVLHHQLSIMWAKPARWWPNG